MSLERIDGPVVTSFDFRRTLDAMVDAGKYDRVDPDFGREFFQALSFLGEGLKTFRTRFYCYPHGGLAPELSLRAMKSEKFIPATYAHGLALGATFPDEQRKRRITCLGTVVLLDRFRAVACLAGSNDVRSLDIEYWADTRDLPWATLGVQEISGA